MLVDLTYDNVRKNIDAMRALGLSNGPVYLRDDSGNHPWHLVTRCEPGGSHRLDIATSVRFYAFDPDLRLELGWSFDIEPYSANGKGHYELDTEGTAAVISKLSGPGREQFTAYLLDCVNKVRNKGDEYAAVASKQYAYADRLKALC